jgi:hypothetical protein
MHEHATACRSHPQIHDKQKEMKAAQGSRAKNGRPETGLLIV